MSREWWWVVAVALIVVWSVYMVALWRAPIKDRRRWWETWTAMFVAVEIGSVGWSLVVSLALN